MGEEEYKNTRSHDWKAKHREIGRVRANALSVTATGHQLFFFFFFFPVYTAGGKWLTTKRKKSCHKAFFPVFIYQATSVLHVTWPMWPVLLGLPYSYLRWSAYLFGLFFFFFKRDVRRGHRNYLCRRMSWVNDIWSDLSLKGSEMKMWLADRRTAEQTQWETDGQQNKHYDRQADSKQTKYW